MASSVDRFLIMRVNGPLGWAVEGYAATRAFASSQATDAVRKDGDSRMVLELHEIVSGEPQFKIITRVVDVKAPGGLVELIRK